MALNRYGWSGRGGGKAFRQRYKTQKRQADSSVGNENGGRKKEKCMFGVNISSIVSFIAAEELCFDFLDGFHLESMPWIRNRL